MMFQGITSSAANGGPLSMYGYAMPGGMALGMWITVVLLWVWLGVGIVAMLTWMSRRKR